MSINIKLFIILIFNFLIPSSLANIALTDFYSFGVTNNDDDLRPSNLDDGSSPAIALTTGFPYFNTVNTALWVNINGAISLRNAIFAVHPYLSAGFALTYSMISPFWADGDLRVAGNVYYRQTSDADGTTEGQ